MPTAVHQDEGALHDVVQLEDIKEPSSSHLPPTQTNSRLSYAALEIHLVKLVSEKHFAGKIVAPCLERQKM